MDKLSFAAATDRGTVRVENQDAILADPPVFLVADGIGGQSGGGLASEAIVEEFRALVGASVTPQLVLSTVRRAHDRVVSLHDDNPGAGSTLCAAIAVHTDGADQWMITHLGDSRCYLVHDVSAEDDFGTGGDGAVRRVVEQLTVDHSLVQEMIEAGVLDEQAAEHHPIRHVITRAMGADQPADPDVVLLPREPGQRLLVCSDGLVNAISQPELESILLSSDPPGSACQALMELALRYGARDNVSAIVVEVQDG